MEARAILRYARISPRKVSIVMDLIRNTPVDESLAILQYTPKAACEPLLKLVKSAGANAENNFNMDKKMCIRDSPGGGGRSCGKAVHSHRGAPPGHL